MSFKGDPTCLFCRMSKGEIPSQKVFEDDLVFAFKDINPQAPFHVLIVPKKHIESLSDISQQDEEIVGHLQSVISKIAETNVGKDGSYRVVINRGIGAGQSVFHLHYHLLAGRTFGWPPG
ncbi:MAG: histidine triad nucleotide-binding protein [bacterium (Candidatus Ratteibacteria) CG23_combo_of_CG06-09_8_20_14_all_48_7]|uniref:Histidine triad nucleotide-binding protein n=1 Tax=bacterium (Candidatus Ratteibacteria) CG23_combo_of_CG06-09_8_20_14_all_48_7 TaxID=2014292 RepID=A0A2G9Y956_9BACT|nr:MAG: histidine triad nucleotide-binding protein [bacterium (Candidatus Ratteibacteria) CG23_combo_of_CG06-09_8_20_14_all_48_7]